MKTGERNKKTDEKLVQFQKVAEIAKVQHLARASQSYVVVQMDRYIIQHQQYSYLQMKI